MSATRSGALAALLSLLAAVATADDDALYALFYDLEVAGYCGLVDARVGEGFRAERRRLIARDGITGEHEQALRGRAWQAAHAQWQDRGLGGFKGWCRGDGVEAARRLASFAP